MATQIGIKITHGDLSNFDSQGYIARLIALQRDKSIPELELAFRQTVDGWEHRPDFKGEQRVTGDSITLSVMPTGPHAELYGLVSSGSPRHVIRPRSGGMLSFQTGYRPATRPRLFSSRAKQRFGSFVSARAVFHPGFEGREFAQAIQDTYAPIFFSDMQSAMEV